MQGTNLFTLVPGSTTCWVGLTEEYGEINGNQPGMVAKCIGVPPVTAYVFGTGCLMLRMDTGSTYQNTGTFAVPYWTLMATGGGGGGSAYNLNNALGYAMLAGTSLTLTSFSSPSIIATGNIGETTKAGVAGVFGSGSDTVAASPYATAITDVASLYATMKALTGTAITTPSALETNNLSGLGAGVFAPGIYTTASAIGMTASQSITLSGVGDYVFVSTGGAITFGANDTIVLTNGAVSGRVFFVANNAITTGSTCNLSGNFMSGAAITIGSTNIISGRLLSPSTVVVDGTASTFTLPAGSSGSLTAGTVVEGTNTTGPVFQTINTGVYTGIGVDQTLANALTVGVGHLISVTGLTTGIGEQIVATQATMTTGRFLSFNNGATEVFGVGLNGHLISTASANPPTIVVTNAAGISGAAITAGGTDTCGVITTTGTSTSGTILTVTFGKTYTAIPKAVMLTPLNAAATTYGVALNVGAYVSTVSATQFAITLTNASGATPSWSYLVVG
jgi:hypothetical protein